MSDDPFIRIAREAAGAPYRPPKSTQQNGGAASPVNDITPIPNTREAVANLIETLGPGMSLMARSSTIEMALDGLGKLRIEPALTDQFLQEIRDRAGTSITELRKMLKKGQRRNKVPIPFGDVARMIERHVYVKQVGAFWDRTARTVVDVKAVREAYWSKMPMDEHGERLDPYGLLIKGEQGFAAERADRFVFRPGADEFFEDDRGCNALNIWVKPKLEPREGDVTPFLGHVEYLLNGDARMIDHQIDFLAHLVQRPEIKMKSTILIVGPPGVGKTFIAEWMVPLLGEENVAFIDSSDLENQFNGYMDGKVLVVVNELIALSKKASNKLKSYITDAKMTINRKNIPTYDYNNCANFLLYSNYEDAAKIDPGDRRFAIEISHAIVRDPAYYEGLWRWFENGGAEHLLFFLHTRNLDKFKPFAAPPVTAAKLQMIDDSRDPVQAYLHETFVAGDSPFQHDLLAVNQVIDWLSEKHNMRVTHKQVSSFLRSIRAEWLGQRSLRDDWRPVVWAIRNGPEWGQVGLDDLKLAWRDIGVASITDELRNQFLGRSA